MNNPAKSRQFLGSCSCSVINDAQAWWTDPWRTKVRVRALESERAQEGESPSVAELPATNGK
jgi:hypothetical protein